MIHKFLSILALLSCFQLMANDPTQVHFDDHSLEGLLRSTHKSSSASDNDVTSPIVSKLSNKVSYSQYPTLNSKKAGQSAYFAVKDGLLILKSFDQTGIELAETLDQLKDPVLSEQLFGKEDSQWRLAVIENRKQGLASDYINDIAFLSVKGAEKVAYSDITSLDYSLLFLEKAVVKFDKQETLKAQEELNALTALLPSVIKRLTLEAINKKADGSYSYAITRDTFLQTVKDEAALKSKTDLNKGLARLQQPEVLESYFPSLTGIEFTLKGGINENSIESIDAAGNPKNYTWTYLPTKEATEIPGLTLEQIQKPIHEADMLSTPPTSPVEYMNGDCLSSIDVTKLVEYVKDNPTTLFDIDELSDTPVHCLESSKQVSFLQDLDFEYKASVLVKDLEKAPSSYSSIIPINCDGHWIACVVNKTTDGIDLVVADSHNKDRRYEPAILKLSAALEDIYKKKDTGSKKIQADDYGALSGAQPSAPAQDNKDEAYDAPLAQFALEDLPALGQFFGGKTPNDISVRLHLLKAGQNIKTAGTKIKNCLLLYGPPGTGKSTLAQVLARMAGWDCLFVNGGSFRTAYQGSSRELLLKLFAEAKKRKKPVVIIIDEIDGTSQQGGPNNSTQEDNRAIKILIGILDQYRHDPNIFVIGTSNYPEKIEPAILRRFTCIEVPLPNYATRTQILEHYLLKNDIKINGEDEDAVSPDFLEALIRATKGFSGDNLEDMVANAILHSKLKLAPEKEVGMGFWFNGIDTSKSVAKNIWGLLENPYVPLIYMVGGYANTTFDKHLYSQYKKIQKLRDDLDEKASENDPNNKPDKRSMRKKIKAALWSALQSSWHGLFTQAGHDVYNTRVRPPVVNTWNWLTR